MYRLIGSVHTLSGVSGAVAGFLRSMDSVRRSIAINAGLSASELRAMARIAESDTVTPKQLADDLEITTGAITAITNTLVAKGLITRVENARDRRSLLVKLTDSGHAVMEGVYEQFHEALVSTTNSLGAEDEAAFIRGLNAITTNIASAK